MNVETEEVYHWYWSPSLTDIINKGIELNIDNDLINKLRYCSTVQEARTKYISQWIERVYGHRIYYYII